LFLRTIVVALALLASAGCLRDLVGEDPPAQSAHFPQGLALHPDGKHLLVVSSNFDLKYNRGALLVADLDAVDQALANGAAESPLERQVPGDAAWVSAAFIPSFGSRPALTPDGKRAFVATRGANQIAEVEISANGTLSCGEDSEEGAAPECGQGSRVLQVPANDPYHLVLTAASESRVDGVATKLGSAQVVGFVLDPQRDDGSRLRLSALWSLGEDVLGVRGIAALDTGRGPALLVGTEVLDPSSRQGFAAELAVLDARLPENLVRTRHSLTEDLGARSVREVTLTADGKNALVILRVPDGIARYAIDEDVDGRIRLQLAASVGACRSPTAIRTFTLDTPSGPLERAALTCFDDDTLLLVDPLTLATTDASRFFGRGPSDVVVDVVRNRLYVSYFLDDTIGVFSLVDDDGNARLQALGRIGEPRAKPEDGRQ
jgi:DNA-binding beta-propeller fold protein YncE